MKTLAFALVAVALSVPAVAAEDAPRRDLAMHFTAGLGVGAMAHALTDRYAPQLPPIASAVGAAVLAGLAKEAADMLGMGDPDWMDWAATACGGVAAAIVGDLARWLIPMLPFGRSAEVRILITTG